MTSEIHPYHSSYIEKLFTNRFIRHNELKSKILEIKSEGLFEVTEIGKSVQQREIYKLRIGTGSISILLWSQMHGDEPTGTLAMFDLFNFFVADDEYNLVREQILKSCTLHFIPVVNPDGAEAWQRRNAQGIDINRDFLQTQSPEGKLLVKMQAELKPDFGFNIHDMETLWSVSGTKKPASIAFLAPAANDIASITPGRLKAMQVIGRISELIEKQIPGQVGRWSEDFEPRAFGDNFQRLGTSTILIESGGYKGDSEKQYVRKLNFDAILYALVLISEGEYESDETSRYYAIPESGKYIFHILIKNCRVETECGTITVDVGLNYKEEFDLPNRSSKKIYSVADFGDLSVWNAYQIIDAKGAFIPQLTLDEIATFEIKDANTTLITLQEGLLI